MIGNKKINKNKNTQEGFTLFYALLVASLALAIGASIYDITVREIDLSSTTAQSEYAVFIADSGAECALYWDSKYNYGNAATNNGGSNSAFATSTYDVSPQVPSSGIYCSGQDVAAAAVTAGTWPTTTGPSAANTNAATSTITVYGVAYKNQTPCAVVTIAKSGNPSQTTIVSHGYNTCTSGGLQIERELKVSY